MNLELYHFLWGVANTLHATGNTIPGGQLANILNQNGFRTTYGSRYMGRRGTYKLFSAVWHWLHYDMGLPDEARKVAYAFTDRNGRIPHE